MSAYADLPGLDVDWFAAWPVPEVVPVPPRPDLAWAYPVCSGCGHSMRDLCGPYCAEPMIVNGQPCTCRHYCEADPQIMAYRMRA